MLTGIAFCPQAPALVPDVGRGLDAELGPVRAACRAAIRRVAAPCSRIVVVGSGPVNAAYGPTSRGSYAGFGIDLTVPLGSEADGPTDLPPALAVGAWLVRDALGPDTGASGYAISADDDDLPAYRDDVPTVLIVLGDGSAQRSEKAPGYLNPEAAAFDDAVASAMRGGRGELLHVADEGAEVMAAGAGIWEAVAWIVESTEWESELLYDDAPFGVGYFVATWTARELTTEQRAATARSEEILRRWNTEPEFRRTHRVVLRG